MKNIQKIGALGAFLQAIYFVVLVLFITIILPSQGLPVFPTSRNSTPKTQQILVLPI